jgi:glycosylphosphatidylinositol transamidase (GPIT) subunit GPI8
MRFEVLLNKLTVEKFHSIAEIILDRLEKDDYLSRDFFNRLSKNGWVPH